MCCPLVRSRAAALALLLTASTGLLPSLALGQVAFTPEKNIAHIQNRAGKKSELALTGFFVKGQKGIITSLHGVVKYPDIWAGRHEGAKYLGYDKVKIIKVDIRRDLALVSSPEIDMLPVTNGFEEVPLLSNPDKDREIEERNALALQGLRVIGFPRAIFLHQRYDLTLANRNLTGLVPLLKELGPIYDELSERGSPVVSTEVLSLSGFLQPGLSGGPIINKDNKLVGVANGRVPSDPNEARGTGWAIPTPLRLADPNVWKDPEDVKMEMEDLKKRKLTFHTAVVSDPGDLERFRNTVDAQKQFSEFAKKKEIENAFASFQRFVDLQNESMQINIRDLQGQSTYLVGEMTTLKTRLDEIEKKRRPPGSQGSDPVRECCGLVSPSSPAKLLVQLPADAKLTIDNYETKSTGIRRQYDTPPIPHGVQYFYTLKASLEIDGKMHEVTRQVPVRAGQTSQVSFDELVSAAAAARDVAERRAANKSGH
jgi:uncharacterized protein (TIGR03000 family)